MLLFLLRLTVDFFEGVFGIANCLSDNRERFGHSLIECFKFSQALKDANGLPLKEPTVHCNWHQLLQALSL